MTFFAVLQELGELVFKGLLICPVATSPLSEVVGIRLLDGKPDFAAINSYDLDSYYVIVLQVVIDIMNKSVGYLRNVNQARPPFTNIDECSESGDSCDAAFQD
jgi:hypothetical protein